MQSPTVATETHEPQLYDSLNPQLPVYSVPNKKSANALPSPQDDQIYDSIANVTTETTLNETPPPIPIKRVPSDGGMSTSSNEHSPRCDRRRHSSGEDDHRHCSRHRSRKHKRHSSRRNSDCHCYCYDDQSPERSDLVIII